MIRTSCICPPIPMREFDFACYDAQYCGCEDCIGAKGSIVGYGATEAEARRDYEEQIDEQG